MNNMSNNNDKNIKKELINSGLDFVLSVTSLKNHLPKKKKISVVLL